MNFITNRITNPAGNGPTLDEWIAKNFKMADVEEAKVASEAKPECNDDPRGQGRGQVINNDNEKGANSYQKGESVDGKEDQAEGKKSLTETEVKEANCAKEMGECSKAGDVTEDHSDAANADVGNAEVSQNINNDPNYQKGESTDPGKVKGKNKKDTYDKVVGKASSRKYQKVASMTRQDKIKLFAVLAANKVNPLNYVEAMVGFTFANMTEDEKNFIRRFWRTMYPRDYVEEMVADR